MTYRGYDDRGAAQFDGDKILFWRDESLDRFTSQLGGVFGSLLKSRGDDPKDFVRRDIPYDDRQTVARALEIRSTMNPNGGAYGIAYMGWANCRICRDRLGTRDMIGNGFVWPEKAEHYLLSHSVWTPGCDRMLVAIRKKEARP